MSAPNKSYDPVEVDGAERRKRSSARATRRSPPSPPPATSTQLQGGTARARRRPLAARPGQPRDRRAAARTPRPRPASGSARPAARSTRRSPPGRPSWRPSATRGSWSRRRSTSRCRATARPRGARHPLTTLAERIADVFVAMGYEVAEGPEVEAEWFNFDALNIAARPPGPRRCRTPSSSRARRRRRVRCRAAHPHLAGADPRRCSTRELPIYVVCPGRVYRTDELDATHTPVFHQVEGLAVDEGLTMADLQGHPRPLRRRRCSARA